jgi:hypothetical protein
MNKDPTDKFQKPNTKYNGTMYGNNRQKKPQIYYQHETKYTTN